MDQPIPAGGRCELTPPIDLSIINDRNKQSLGCDMNSPTLHPLSKPRGFHHITQPSPSISFESAHTITCDPITVCDQTLRASIEDGAKKLPGRRISSASVPMHIPVMHAVATSNEEPNVGRHLITPPPLPTPAKSRRPTPSRCPITRKQAASRERSGLLDEENSG